jgi:exosome complex component RRP43
MITARDLKIEYEEPHTDEDLPDEGPKLVTKAYWTLYIDILCIALDGNAFDAACTAMIAALQQTVLPKAWWDPDREMIVCSPRLAEASRLRLSCLPISSTFAVFSTASPLKLRSDARKWILSDPDNFEEEVTTEFLTVTVVLNADQSLRVVRVEKSGGSALGKDAITSCIRSAEERCTALTAMLNPP